MKSIFKIHIILSVVLLFSINSCQDDFLQERPPGSLSSDIVLTNKSGFENYLAALHYAARDELSKYDSFGWYINQVMGTDIACSGENAASNFRNWETYLTPATQCVERYWDWAYGDMLVKANTIIAYAGKQELNHIWSGEDEKNAIIAEAKFFRAYTHNFLANLYGGIPIVDTIYSSPKTDFVRNTREEVYQSARKDLEFASQWLPETVPPEKEGRIVKAAADHLLTEVYISLGEYDKAIESASRVINSGLYHLMTERFGSQKDMPGDVYSDLFKTGNQNRSSGNMESIYVWQYEDETPGGRGSQGNYLLRAWAPFLINVKDPDGKPGMIIVDSIGRGVGWVRPTNYFLYNLWEDNWDNDIRNSPHNIRRTHYYNNPASEWFGKPVEKSHYAQQDTFQMIYPTLRKVEGELVWDAKGGRAGWTYNDIMVYRLAETYLLRAEAYMYKGDLVKAAADINMVRARAQAKPVSPAEVTLDYILDERGRELITEEPRHRTLVRTGKLVERVRKYNLREDARATIQEKHALWPIPQKAIDANFSAKLEQNPGY